MIIVVNSYAPTPDGIFGIDLICFSAFDSLVLETNLY